MSEQAAAHDHERAHAADASLTRSAFSATAHCLTGCAIALAFFFGYSLTLGPVFRAGVPFRRALRVASAPDTASISVMEIVDNAFILLVPGAIDAELNDGLFWWSLGVSVIIAFGFALPLNRWLIARGKGHAVAHAYHSH